MADEATPFSNIDFSETSAGTQMLNDFLSETVTEDPTKVKTIEQDEKEKELKKKTEEQKKAEKAEALAKLKKEQEEASKKSLDTLLSEEEEEIEEEEEDPLKTKVKAEKKKEKTEDGTSTDDSQESNTFTELSKELFDLGVFSKDSEDDNAVIDTPEKFAGRFNYEAEKKANQRIENFIGKFGEDYQQAFEAIYVNGVDPKEYFTVYNEVADLSNLDLKVEANQEAVIRQDFQERGYTPDQIKVKLEKLKNYGDLEEEATHSHSVLLKNQTAKLMQIEENKKTQLAQQAAVKQQYLINVKNTLTEKVKNKEFDGIPINPVLAQELQDYLTVDKWRTSSGENLTDFDKFILDLKKPENHQMKVKMALLFKTLEKDPTLKTIQKAGVSKESNILFKNLIVKKEKSSIKEKTTSDFGSDL